MIEREPSDLIAVNEFGFYVVPNAFKTREVPKLLLAGEVYEPNTIRLIQRLANKGDVVSGGAFIGDFLPAISQALANGRILHTFEPAPLSLRACRANIELNNLTNVSLHPVAVGSVQGELPLQISKASGASMGARAKIAASHAQGETIMVAVKPIDDLVGANRKVSVLHLDIEGHEYEAIKGAQKTIEKSAPVIILEADKPWMQRDYEEKLNNLFPDLEYRFSGTMEGNAFYLPSV